VRRIGVLVAGDENDPVSKTRLSAFTQALSDLGWTDGRNVRMDLRGGYARGRRRADARTAVTMMRRMFRWFFENRETGAITIAQAPNLSLWIVIVVGALIWAWHPSDRLGVILEIIFKGALFFWAFDELLRGVNPWRRCLGVAVLCYGLWTLSR
jgi:hypothetical protein